MIEQITQSSAENNEIINNNVALNENTKPTLGGKQEVSDPLLEPLREEEKAAIKLTTKKDDVRIIAPVPDDVPAFDCNACDYFNKKFGCDPSYIYPYYNVEAKLMGYMVRWDIPQSDESTRKETRPYAWCEYQKGKYRWQSKGLPEPLTLYNLPEIINRPDAPVLIVEGEKTVDAAQKLFPDYVVTTSAGGAQSANKTDWSTLRGRKVVISPDCDEPGAQYAKAVQKLCQRAGASSVQILYPETYASYVICDGQIAKRKDDIPKGYDLADALDEGWTAQTIMQLQQKVEELDEAWLLEVAKSVKNQLNISLDDDSHEPENPSNNKPETDEECFERLRALSPIDYGRARKSEATRLGIKLSLLDTEVDRGRSQSTSSQSGALELFPEIEPWPEFVDAASLLDNISSTIKQFSILPEHGDTATTLWVVFSWFIDSVDVAPILSISSPEKQCGKTTLLTLLGKISKNPMVASNISPAALFRSIEYFKPTLLIDEADTFIKDSEELRGVLNSGHTRDAAFVIRNVGENHTPTQFSTWGAKGIALIGTLPDTLHDRSVVILLRRKLSHEKTERLRHADPSIFHTLQSKLSRFSNDHAAAIKKARPIFPEYIDISDRALDNWEPLLAIAELGGSTWIHKAHEAAKFLSSSEKDASPINTELLKDIQKIFEDKHFLKVRTTDLINALCEDEEAPWSTYNKYGGQIKRITPPMLNKLLKPYGIRSKNIKISNGTVYKGFDKSQFEDAWTRYLSISPPEIAATPLPMQENIDRLRVTEDYLSATDAATNSLPMPLPLLNNPIAATEDTRKTAVGSGVAAVAANLEGTEKECEYQEEDI